MAPAHRRPSYRAERGHIMDARGERRTAARRVGRVAAALLGTAAFVTYQLVFVIFNR
jgi:hypothetical protein